MRLHPREWAAVLGSLWRFGIAIVGYCLSVLPALAGQDGQFIWNTQSGGVIVVRYLGAEATVAVPATLEGQPVVAIGSGAFSNCVTVTNITLPDGILRLGEGAFSDCTSLAAIDLGGGLIELGPGVFYRCANLSSLVLPPTVNAIPERAFNGCARLAQLVVPDSVTRIGTNAFAGCYRLADLTLGAGITAIEPYAFYGCSSLATLDLPAGLASIGEQAFRGCSTLLAMSLPHSVTNLGSGAFTDCQWLAAVGIGNGLRYLGENVFNGCNSLTDIWVNRDNLYFGDEDGVLYTRDHSVLLQFPPGRAGTFAVPAGVTHIAPYAFSGCAQLLDVTLPAGMVKIGEYAFYGCTALTNVMAGSTLATVGNYAFAYCTQLGCVYFKGPPPALLGESVFFGSLQLIVFHQPGSSGWEATFGGMPVDIWYEPAGLAYEIGATGITITKYTGGEGGVAVPAFIHGRKVVAIAAKAFQDNHRLGSVLLPEGVESIGSGAFTRCAGLTNLALPANLRLIASYAFADCRALETVVLPDSVAELGDGAFYHCTQLRRAVLPAGLSTMGLGVFSGCASLAEVVVPAGAAQIGTRAFSDCPQLTTIALPASVASLGAAPFYNCTALTNIAVDFANPSFLSVDGVLFDRAQRNLLAFPAGRTGAYTVPAGVTNIDYAAFCHSEGLTGVILPDGLLSLGYMAFYECPQLSALVLPSSVKVISNYAFSGCAALTQLGYDGNAPALSGDYAFFNAPQLTNYFVPGTRGWGSSLGGRPAVPWPLRFEQWAASCGLAAQYPDARAMADDPDGDGLSNVQEMAAGTDPSDPASVLRFEPAARPAALSAEDQAPLEPGQAALYFQSVPGKNYEVLASPGVPGPWNSVATAAATTTQKRVLLPWPATNAIYRLKLSP